MFARCGLLRFDADRVSRLMGAGIVLFLMAGIASAGHRATALDLAGSQCPSQHTAVEADDSTPAPRHDEAPHSEAMELEEELFEEEVRHRHRAATFDILSATVFHGVDAAVPNSPRRHSALALPPKAFHPLLGTVILIR